jgi:lipoprotein Spr
MKHLFFVSVALGIFSGTSLNAQTSVNLARLSDDVSAKNTVKFIDGIAINPHATDFGGSIETCSPLQFKYAQLLNVDVESLSNSPLYNFIEEWWATRYHFGGTTKKGIDCSAYSGALLGKVWGIKTPRTARAMYDVATKVDRNELKEGDLVFFNTRGGVSHVGVYLGNGYFTHSSTGNGVTINNLEESYYHSKFICGGRLTAPDTCNN